MTKFFLTLLFAAYTLSAQTIKWKVLPTFPGPEDITWDHHHAIAFISCDERRKKSSLSGQNGKILAFYNDQILNLHEELPFPFHPHGIDFEESQNLLYVINHRKKHQATIEVFQFSPQSFKLSHLKTIEDPKILSPNDLYVVHPDTFYFSNDPNGRSFLYLLLNYLFRLKTDKVVAYENGKMRTFCKMNYPNGIAQVGQIIFISAIYKRRIEVYDLQGKKLRNIPLKAAPDNLEIDANHHLWTAGHLHFSQFLRHMKDSTAKSPSILYQIHQPTLPNPMINEIALPSNTVQAASVASPHQNTLLVGCVFDGKILVGRIEK